MRTPAWLTATVPHTTRSTCPRSSTPAGSPSASAFLIVGSPWTRTNGRSSARRGTAMYSVLPSWRARRRTGSWGASGFDLTTPAASHSGSPARRSAAASAPRKFGIRPRAPGKRAAPSSSSAPQIRSRTRCLASTAVRSGLRRLVALPVGVAVRVLSRSLEASVHDPLEPRRQLVQPRVEIGRRQVRVSRGDELPAQPGDPPLDLAAEMDGTVGQHDVLVGEGVGRAAHAAQGRGDRGVLGLDPARVAGGEHRLHGDRHGPAVRAVLRLGAGDVRALEVVAAERPDLHVRLLVGRVRTGRAGGDDVGRAAAGGLGAAREKPPRGPRDAGGGGGCCSWRAHIPSPWGGVVVGVPPAGGGGGGGGRGGGSCWGARGPPPASPP